MILRGNVRPVHRMAVVLLSLLCGCGGGSTTTTHFSKAASGPLTLTPSQAAVVPGQPAVFTVQLSAATPPAGPIVLEVSGLPGQANAVFAPSQVTLTPGALTGTSTLTITPDASTPPGVFPLLIQGTTDNAVFGSALVNLNVQAVGTAASGFDLIITPAFAQTLPNAPAIFDVLLVPAPGFHDNVRVNVSGGNGSFVVQQPTFHTQPTTSGLLIPPSDTFALQGLPVQTSFTVSQTLGVRSGTAANLTVTATNGVSTQTAVVTVQAQ